METQFLTSEGYERILTQLELLRTVKRAEVAQYLRESAEAGELINNAAYEDARQEQARLEGRIRELEHLLATAILIDQGRTDVVSLGSVVHLVTHDGREYRYIIVGSYEADPGNGRISNESPVGKALLGHKMGDQVMAATPGGVKEYTIVSVQDGISVMPALLAGIRMGDSGRASYSQQVENHV